MAMAFNRWRRLLDGSLTTATGLQIANDDDDDFYSVAYLI